MRLRRAQSAPVGTQSAVVGLDISLVGPGLCVAAGDPRARVGSGLSVETALISAGKDLRGPQRLSVVTKAIWSWLLSRGAGKPGDLYVTEGYAFSRSHAHSLGEIGGCLRRIVYESGGNLLVVPPSTLKRFVTGKGIGDKNVMMKAVFKRWFFDVDEDNQCDAFACAVLGLIERAGSETWTAVERDILTKKVERFGGNGQQWGQQTPKRRRR